MVGRVLLVQRLDEQRDHARVRRAGILPRPKHVEIARRHRLESVEAREHLPVHLAHQLLQRVRRQRIGRHRLGLWQHLGVAVDRRRAGEDQALDAAVARRDQHLQHAVDVGAMRFERLIHRARHRGNGRLVKHVVHAGDDRRRERRIRAVALHELDALPQVLLVAGDEVVGDANAMPALDEFFGNVGADEAGAARNEIISQSEIRRSEIRNR